MRNDFVQYREIFHKCMHVNFTLSDDDDMEDNEVIMKLHLRRKRENDAMLMIYEVALLLKLKNFSKDPFVCQDNLINIKFPTNKFIQI